MNIKDKIARASNLLDEALEELSSKGIDTESDLMLYLKDAVLASDHAYQHVEIHEEKS